jgi:hypothetical protein
MTITTERTASAVKDPRELISEELFGKLVGRVQEEMPVATFYAERMVEQMLVFMQAIAQNPTNKMLTPSAAVDPAWHAFVAHTREYAAFCNEITGGAFIHHIPVINGDILSGKSLQRTLEVMRSTGYPVEEGMWQQWTSCGSTTNCDFAVER